jgi:hypothetical protein
VVQVCCIKFKQELVCAEYIIDSINLFTLYFAQGHDEALELIPV